MSYSKEIDETINAVLVRLFDVYKHTNGQGEEVGRIILERKLEPHVIGQYMVDLGLVKDQCFFGKEFYATITFEGIRRIEPNYVDNIFQKIISTLGMLDDWMEVKEVIDLDHNKTTLAADIVFYFRDKGYIEIQTMPPYFHIKLSQLGKEIYNSEKPSFE